MHKVQATDRHIQILRTRTLKHYSGLGPAKWPHHDGHHQIGTNSYYAFFDGFCTEYVDDLCNIGVNLCLLGKVPLIIKL